LAVRHGKESNNGNNMDKGQVDDQHPTELSRLVFRYDHIPSIDQPPCRFWWWCRRRSRVGRGHRGLCRRGCHHCRGYFGSRTTTRLAHGNRLGFDENLLLLTSLRNDRHVAVLAGHCPRQRRRQQRPGQRFVRFDEDVIGLLTKERRPKMGLGGYYRLGPNSSDVGADGKCQPPLARPAHSPFILSTPPFSTEGAGKSPKYSRCLGRPKHTLLPAVTLPQKVSLC
jgi:hypothetical protein